MSTHEPHENDEDIPTNRRESRAHKHASHGHAQHGGGHEEGHEGAPEWLISFADNTALMMGFFVIMLALNMAVKGASSQSDSSNEQSEAAASSGQSAAQLDFALGVREAFHNPVTLNSDRPEDRFLVMRLREKLAGENPAAEETVAGKADRPQSLDRGMMESHAGRVSFDQDSVKIDPAGQATIESFYRRAAGLQQVVDVRGHASTHESATQPGHGVPLSWERAFAVATKLHELGLPWNRMRVVAAGSSEPLINRDYTLAEGEVNSRVEMTLTDDLAER